MNFKQKILILISLFTFSFSFAQNGKIEYYHKMAEDNFTHEGTLSFTPLESQYTYKQIEGDHKVLQEPSRIQNVYSDPIGHFYYQNKVEKQSTERLFSGKEKFIIEAELNSPKWKMNGKEKEISGYACQQATTKFRGRKYTAWFTPQIPVDVGPWKLTGLPGLILEAYDKHQDVHFQVKRIQLFSDPITIVPEKDGQIATFEQYRAARIKAFKAEGERMRAKAEMIMATSDVEIEIESPDEPIFTERSK